MRLQRYLTTTKRYPPKKLFGNSEFCSSHQNHSRPNSLENRSLGEKNKIQSFQKLFSGDNFLYSLNIFATAASKLKQKKQIKNYKYTILAIINHYNWLDDSPPLSLQIIAVMHHKPKKTKFWASGVRKRSWWGTFLKIFQKLF